MSMLMKFACFCVVGDMFSRWYKFGWESDEDANTETLSQAIRAAASEAPDADGRVLFGHLKGNVVGLKYYTGVVRVKQHLFTLPRTADTCGHINICVFF